MRQSEKSIIDHKQDFLDWLDVEKGLSSKSQENYARFLKKFLDWLKENCEEISVCSSDLNSCRTDYYKCVDYKVEVKNE